MEDDLIARLDALVRVLSQKRDIESATLERLNKDLDEVVHRQSALEQKNREEMAQLSLPGAALTQWTKRFHSLRNDHTNELWQTKAKIETQKMVLRRAIAQHQALLIEREKRVVAERQRKDRRADYAS